jgi:uncharacterized protein (DUF427 family)
VHPRNPYVRVDALRSTRPVRVELDGVVLDRGATAPLVPALPARVTALWAMPLNRYRSGL